MKRRRNSEVKELGPEHPSMCRDYNPRKRRHKRKNSSRRVTRRRRYRGSMFTLAALKAKIGKRAAKKFWLK